MSLNLLKSNWLFYQSNLYGLAIDQKGSAMTLHVVKWWKRLVKPRWPDNQQRVNEGLEKKVKELPSFAGSSSSEQRRYGVYKF